ncbi:hypothetical protein AAFN86_28680 [Roseomonas sp. CAU 1739]|uniref:hypothetical protein n=1 Tax=Roseomonas sp. CAU 1739 TaxID=3140364 RepID=UPI00325ACEB4
MASGDEWPRDRHTRAFIDGPRDVHRDDAALLSEISGLETEISALRNEITALSTKVETLRTDRVAPTVSEAADRAGIVAHDAVAAVQQSAAAMASTVRGQPLTTVGAAMLAGFTIAQLMRR